MDRENYERRQRYGIKDAYYAHDYPPSADSVHYYKRAIVLGGAGFIGLHLVDRLKSEGYWVRVIDYTLPENLKKNNAHEYVCIDLKPAMPYRDVIGWVSLMPLCGQMTEIEVYQLASEFSGTNSIAYDADLLNNSLQINLNLCKRLVTMNHGGPGSVIPLNMKVFYGSSSAVYPDYNLQDKDNPICAEATAIPASPPTIVGWEKLISEKVYMAFASSYKLDARIGRIHNVYGPYNDWRGIKERVVEGFCRKVITATDEIEIHGDGTQKRSFLYIDDCIDAIRKVMQSHFTNPLNIGSDQLVSINELVDMLCSIENKQLKKKYVDVYSGVPARVSDNTLIEVTTGWKPSTPLMEGLKKTYYWVKEQIEKEAATS